MKSREPTTSPPLSERYNALLGLGRTLLGSSNSWDLYQSIYVETAKVIELSGFFLSLYDDQSDVATVVFSVAGGKESKFGLTYRGSDLPPRVVPHPMLVPAPVEGREGRASSGTRATA